MLTMLMAAKHVKKSHACLWLAERACVGAPPWKAVC